MRHFSHICTRVMALDLLKIIFALNIFILENKLTYFHQAWDFVTCHISQSCTRVMALDLCQIFVSAQYLENQLIEFQVFCMHSY